MSGRGREPVFNLPGVILLLLAGFAGVHVLRLYGLEPMQDAYLLRAFSFVPGQFAFAFDPDAVAAELTRLAQAGERNRLLTSQFFLASGALQPWTPVTYSFIHADWTHLAVNSLWLAAFGVPVARRFGAWRFLAFFVVAAIGGAGAHYLMHHLDMTPVIGASAAVSGATAAALRFVFQPGAPLGPTPWFGPLPPHLAVQAPALGLAGALRDVKVLQFAAIWFAVNLIFGMLAVPLGISDYGIAWEAHVGGFVTGFLLFGLFDPAPRTLPEEPPQEL